MQKLKTFNKILFFMLLGVMLNAQAPERVVVIENIFVNGIDVPFVEGEDILLSSSDTISFFYSLRVNNTPRTPFLFRINLKSGLDSAVRSVNLNNLQYIKLPEGEYSFLVNAFDLAKTWQSNEASVRFRVNNREKALLSQIDSLKSHIENVASHKDDGYEDIAGLRFELRSLLYGVALTFLIGALIFFVFLRKSLNKVPQTKQVVSQTQNIELFKRENENLRLELKQLREQIEGLATRSGDIIKQNRDLEDSVARLTQTKDELESLQLQKDELFAIIIHDIKNPVGVIKNLVELLRSYDLTATEQQEIMDDIVITTSKIVSLSHEVSRVLALEGAKMRLDIDKVSIRDIAEDAFKRNMVKAKKKNIEMIFDVPDDLPLIDADGQKVYEIMDNLLSNGVKFTHSEGLVRIKGQKIDDTVVIEVSDNGLGLTDEDIQRAFKRGSQLSAKPTAGESSTGLGLWIVKKLVEAHGGRVWVRSTIGKGATFAFSIPITSKLESAPIVDLGKK